MKALLAAFLLLAAPPAQVAAARMLVGTVFPYAEIPVITAAAGRVARVPVGDGARVRRGQLLLAIDNTRQVAEIKLLQTQINHKAALRLEELALGTARQDLARDEQLASDGTVTTKALDDSRNKVKLALERVAIERGRLDEQRQALAIKTRELADRDVLAPDSGILTEVLVHPNQIVAAGAKVGDLLRLDQVYVETFVPLADLVRIRVGTRAAVQAERAGSSAGRVTVIGQKVDPVSGSVRVRLLVPNPGYRLKPGMIVRVRV